RVDWALKYLVLDRQRGRRGLMWQSPELKALDLRYASLDPQEGLFFQFAAAGQVDHVPTAGPVERVVDEPPDDTRAYLRAHVLRAFGDGVFAVTWARIRFRTYPKRYWASETVLDLPDPADFGRAVSEPLLSRCGGVRELVEAVAARSPASVPGRKEDFFPREGEWPNPGGDDWLNSLEL